MMKKIKKWPITVFSQEDCINKMNLKNKVKYLKNRIKIPSLKFHIYHPYKLSELLGNKQWMMLCERDFHQWNKKKRRSNERWLLMNENSNEIRLFNNKTLYQLNLRRFSKSIKKKIRMKKLWFSLIWRKMLMSSLDWKRKHRNELRRNKSFLNDFQIYKSFNQSFKRKVSSIYKCRLIQTLK